MLECTEHVLSNEGQVAHVAESDTLGLVACLVVAPLTFNDLGYDLRVAEECDGEVTVQAFVDSPSEDLMQEVVNHIVQKVVPRELEEQLLQ